MRRLWLLLVTGAMAVALCGCGTSGTATGGASWSSGSTTSGVPNTGDGTTAQAPPAASSTPRRTKVYAEISDYHGGVTLYNDTSFTASDIGTIPFGKTVYVTCFWQNNTRQYGSINGLYHVAGPSPYAGKWAIANQFANGQPLGRTTNEGQRDPQVPDC